MTSKLKVKRRDAFLLSIFYIVVGIAQITVLALTDYALFTAGALAVLSFITAYGLFTVKRWSVWLVIGLFFPQFVCGAVTLYASILRYSLYQEITFMLFNIAPALIVVVLTSISSVYVAAKRKSFQQT